MTYTTANETTITVDAQPYEDSDDCLESAAADFRARHGLATDADLRPRWVDEERDEIVMVVPKWTQATRYSVPAHHDRSEVRRGSSDDAIAVARELVAEGYPAIVRDGNGVTVWTAASDDDDEDYYDEPY